MEAIFNDVFLHEHVAMRGGTVLHKGHLAPASRYSEDIDLVLVTDREPRHIELAIHRVLRPILGEPRESFIADVQLAVRNLVAKSKILRTVYTYDPTSPDVALAHLKVEVNTNEPASLYPRVTVDIDVPDNAGGVRALPVPSYDLDEMLGTKLRALFQREHGRDLFDLWWAWQASSDGTARTTVNPQRVGEAFRFYLDREGSRRFTAADAQAELARRMRSQKFLNDMNGYLRAGHSYSPLQAHQDFLTVYLPHL